MPITVPSPLGPLSIWAEAGCVTRLDWGPVPAGDDDPVLTQAAVELAEYFAAKRTNFDVPVALPFASFAKKFAQALIDIPFGDTLTYGQMAKQLGASAQAIGQACGANPIPIIIPCHRVLGTRNLGGYSGRGGVESKVWLLKHEGAGGLLI